MSPFFPFPLDDAHQQNQQQHIQCDSDGALESASAHHGQAGPVHIPYMQDTPDQHEQHSNGAVAPAHELDSSSAGDEARLNFMSQRPSFTVQLPFSAQFADRAPYGSGDIDDGYTYEFESIDKFLEWRRQVEEEDTVEFVKGDSHGSRAVPPRFKEHVKLVCARHNRSGRKTYVKKYPERHRKVPSRKVSSCPFIPRQQ